MSLITLMALGEGSPTRESASLQGSAGSPITRTFVGTPAGQATNVVFTFAGLSIGGNSIERGYVQWDGYIEGDAASYTNIHAWVTPIPWAGSYWIRATNIGDNIAVDELDPTWPPSQALDVWLALTLDTVNVAWGWQHDGITPNGGTIKVELATDSMGTTIVATGYYKGLVSAES